MDANAQTEPWTLQSFSSDFNTDDQVDVCYAMEGLYNHLKEITYFKEFEDEGDFYIRKIVSKLINDPRYLTRIDLQNIFDYFIKCIPLFSAKMPVKHIPLLFDLLFEKLSSNDISFFSKIGGAIEISVLDSSDYDEERQKIFTNYMMNKLIPYISGPSRITLQNLSLNLLANLLEAVPNCITPIQMEEINELIKKLATNLCVKKPDQSMDYILICNSLSIFSKIYFAMSPIKEQYKFLDFIECEINDQNLSIYLLSSIIVYIPQFFKQDETTNERYHFEYYLYMLLPFISDNYRSDNFTDEYVAFSIRYFEALSTLVDHFGNKFTKQFREDSINIGIDFMTIGIDSQDDFEEEEEEANDEIDPLIEGMDVVQKEPDVHVYIMTDDSWKIRVAALRLCLPLAKRMGDDFFSALTEITNEINSPAQLSSLIEEQDTGPKLESMNFFKALIHYCKHHFNEHKEIVMEWLNLIIRQIKVGAGEDVLSVFIDTITYAFTEIKSMITLEITLSAVTNVSKVYHDILTDSFLAFIISVLECSTQIEVLGQVIKLVEIILQKCKPNMLPKCMTILSRIYYYYHKNCHNDTSLHNQLNALNEKAIQFSNQQGEIKPYSITTISVFISCCPGLPTIQKSLETIVNLIDNGAVNKVTTSALSLIAVSESSQLLLPSSKVILEKLKNNLSHGEIALNHLTLMTINTLLQKKIIEPKDCQVFMNTLFDVFNSKNDRDLSLRTMNQINPNGCDSKVLGTLAEGILTYDFDDNAINEILSLVKLSSNNSLDNVKPFAELLINRLTSDSEVNDPRTISNAALAIGVISITQKDYALSLLPTFKGFIENKEKPVAQEFSIRTIGEIGSYVDISSTNGDLVDSIFNLVHDKEQRVFVPASESFGKLSAASPSILQRLINSAKSEDKSFLIQWIFAIQSFVKKAISNKHNVPKESNEQILKSIPELSKFLLANAEDDNKDAALIIAECLAGIIGLSFETSEELINQASYTTIRAICLYMEHFSTYSNKNTLNEDEKKEVLSLIQKVAAKNDDLKPMLNYSILLCLKFAITKNLCQELLDLDLVNLIINSTYKLDSHIIRENVGTTVITEDLGKYLRLAAFTCIEMLIQSDVADQLNYEDIGIRIFYAILDERDEIVSKMFGYKILQKALDIIPLLATSSNVEAREAANTSDSESNSDIVDCLKTLEVFFQNFPSEIMNSYYNALIAIRSQTNLTYKELKRINHILERRANDPILIKIEQDRKYKQDTTTAKSLFVNGYISMRLMEELCPEAASIFANN